MSRDLRHQDKDQQNKPDYYRYLLVNHCHDWDCRQITTQADGPCHPPTYIMYRITKRNSDFTDKMQLDQQQDRFPPTLISVDYPRRESTLLFNPSSLIFTGTSSEITSRTSQTHYTILTGPLATCKRLSGCVLDIACEIFCVKGGKLLKFMILMR